MSKAAELNQDRHESVTNGSLEKRIGDAETVEVEGDEGEESDDYEEIDDEVCVQGNIPTFGSSNHIWQEGGPIAGDEGDEEDEGEEVEKVCICAQPYPCLPRRRISWTGTKHTHPPSSRKGILYFIALFQCIDLTVDKWRHCREWSWIWRRVRWGRRRGWRRWGRRICRGRWRRWRSPSNPPHQKAFNWRDRRRRSLTGLEETQGAPRLPRIKFDSNNWSNK